VFAKLANMIQIKNALWVSKNAEFDPYFESVKKVAKRLKLKKLSTKR
jgi:hypothetical protein